VALNGVPKMVYALTITSNAVTGIEQIADAAALAEMHIES
jgi:hypothetical protein